MEKHADEELAISADEPQEVRPVRLSLHLIVRRHLPTEAEGWNQEQVIEALNKITHLRLDRENIGDIDSLELLGSKVTNIYLQQNHISRIQNLDCLPSLQFLTLAGNRIRRVENLQHLSRLLFLDLSENCIESFDIDEFPQSLIILDLRGNPCCDKADYRGSVVQDLANLKQLDGDEVTKLEKLEVGFQISSEEEGDDDEIDVDGEEEEVTGAEMSETSETRTAFAGTKAKLPEIEMQLQDVTNEMLLRSQNRLEDRFMVHRRHVMEMDNLRIKNKMTHTNKNKATQ